ncbi:hypothetical protein ACAW74_25810 [Fibrella sp. WM1]|uniref:hypothetical protein n=1 Tax=Fibrella musci TaxID=3242485 RepID=UPI003522F611
MKEQIISMIRAERARQIQKWGHQDQPLFVWLLILQEELGEAAKAMLEEKQIDEIVAELVQVTTVAIQIAEEFVKGDNKMEWLIEKRFKVIYHDVSVESAFMKLCEGVGKLASVIHRNEWDYTTFNFLSYIIEKGATTIHELMKKQDEK